MHRGQNWNYQSRYQEEKVHLKNLWDLGFLEKKEPKFPEFYLKRPRLSIREVKKKFEKMKK